MSVKLREDIEALKVAIGTADGSLGDRVGDLETVVGGESSGLVKDVTDLKTTVGGSTSGVVKDVADLKDLIYVDGTTMMLFGKVLTIDSSTHAVTLTDPVEG